DQGWADGIGIGSLACAGILAFEAIATDWSPGTFEPSTISPVSNIAPTTVLAHSQRRNTFCSSELSLRYSLIVSRVIMRTPPSLSRPAKREVSAHAVSTSAAILRKL